MSKFYKGLMWVTGVASLFCLSLVMWSVLQVGWRSIEDKTWQQSIDQQLLTLRPLPGAKDAAAPAALTPQQQVELQQTVAGARALLTAEIRAQDAEERAILDRLITLVGVFSAILGLCAFATVKLSREDSQAQVQRTSALVDQTQKDVAAQILRIDTFVEQTRKDVVAKANDIGPIVQKYLDASEKGLTIFMGAMQDRILGTERNTATELENLTQRTKVQLDVFREQIWNELPEMRNLKDNLRKLILDLDGNIASESNWNEGGTYRKISIANRQKILVAESTVNALQIFISNYAHTNSARQAKLYRALARFYFGRFRAENDYADAERADIYALKSWELEKENAETYELRGALCLAQYRALKKSASEPPSLDDAARLATLLRDAEEFSQGAINKDNVASGASLNLALAARYREDFKKAINVSREAIAKQDEMDNDKVEKYLPSLYLNLACFLGRKAGKHSDMTSKIEAGKEAVAALEEAFKYLQKRKCPAAAETLRMNLKRELSEMDAFSGLDRDSLSSLKTMVESTSSPSKLSI